MEYSPSYIEQKLKAYKTNLLQAKEDWPHDIRSALNYLNANLFDTRCQISNMIEICKLTSNNFSTRFKCYTGKSPVSYIAHHRIEVAKQLLKDEKLMELTIGEIGYYVGYDNANTFTSMFKKLTNYTPRDWRE